MPSLQGSKKYDSEEFKKLYHYRWNEEEAYKLLKCRAELEKFSGKTARAVHQDFHAKVFLDLVYKKREIIRPDRKVKRHGVGAFF